MKNFSLLVSLLFVFSTPLVMATEVFQGIEVSGKAAIAAKPDHFSLSFAITERGKSASKTKAVVDQKSTQVVNTAIKAGIKADNIQSARVRLRPIYQKNAVTYHDIEVKESLGDRKGRIHINKQPLNSGKKGSSQHYIFEVSRQITIQLTQIEDYDRLLDRFVKIGVTNISPLSMSVTNADQLYQQALEQAITIAKEKALKIAARAGVSLGKLIYLKELSYNAPVRMNMAIKSADYESVIHQSQTGNKQVTAEVIARFALQPE